MSLLVELRRRNVFRVAIFYIVSSWLALQVADVLLPAIAAPDWVLRAMLLALAIGFLPALIFAWAFELTPEGLKREKDVDRSESVTHETAKRLDIAVIVLLLGVAALSLFVPGRAPSPSAPEATSRADDERASNPDQPAPEERRRVSIAALPFSNLSGNEDTLPFTNGLHDDLLTQLARIDGLRVISRTSVLDYRNTTKNIRAIGEELGVSHLLEGGVQRAGDRVRINVQLIDALSDEHLWAETYDRELTVANIFSIQTGIAEQIAKALRVSLGAAAKPSLERGTDNLRAYEAYLRAKVDLDESGVGEGRLDRAEESLQEALALDPDFAEAYALLANVWDQRYWFGGRRVQDREQALAYARKAEAIQPDLPQVQQAYAIIYYHGFLDYDRALNHLERVQESLAGDYWTTLTRGAILRRRGDIRESTPIFEEAREINPRGMLTYLDLTSSYLHEQRFEDARTTARALDELGTAPEIVLFNLGEPDWRQKGDGSRWLEIVDRLGAVETNRDGVVLTMLLNALWNAGRAEDIGPYLASIEAQGLSHDEPLALLRARYGASLDPEDLSAELDRLQARILAGYQDPRMRIDLVELLIYAGRKDEAQLLLDSLLADPMVTRDRLSGYDLLGAMLPLMALLEDLDGAFEALETILVAERGFSLAGLVQRPHLEAVMEDPRYQELVERFDQVLEDRSKGVPF